MGRVTRMKMTSKRIGREEVAYFNHVRHSLRAFLCKMGLMSQASRASSHLIGYCYATLLLDDTFHRLTALC